MPSKIGSYQFTFIILRMHNLEESIMWVLHCCWWSFLVHKTWAYNNETTWWEKFSIWCDNFKIQGNISSCLQVQGGVIKRCVSITSSNAKSILDKCTKWLPFRRVLVIFNLYINERKHDDCSTLPQTIQCHTSCNAWLISIQEQEASGTVINFPELHMGGTYKLLKSNTKPSSDKAFF